MAALAERLEAGETVFTAWSGVPDSLTVELVAGLGFDAVTLDMQHGGHHEDSVLRGIGAVRPKGADTIVRVPVGRFDMASRALDFGADAVIAPMINTLDDARRFAASMKYPPLGERSWGPTFGMPRSGAGNPQEWLETANKRTLSFAMVETRAALAILDSILGVEGIDGILVGPADFSIAWSEGQTIDPALEGMMPAIETIAEKTRGAGKHAAIYVMNPALTGRFHAMGYRLFALGSEAVYMSRGATPMLEAARKSVAENT